MITADEAIACLQEVAKGTYQEHGSFTTVKEFTPMPSLPKPEFKLDPQFPQYKKSK